jgi:hypothetical protein
MKHGGGSIMIWGCMTSKGVGFMCLINGRIDANLYQEILSDEFLQTLHFYGLDRDSIIFQHDNDPKHTASSTIRWLRDHNIFVLKWPPQSPDLNPIEHLWSYLKERIRNRPVQPKNKEELWEAFREEWSRIDPDFCAKLISTMPERIAAVLKAKGGNTCW